MEFGRHLHTGLWAFADKFLPVCYGISFVLLVVRVLPREEYGNFILAQDVFLTISGLATAFSLQPMLKYVAEESGNRAVVVTGGVLFYALFVGLVTVSILLLRYLLGAFLNSSAFPALILLLPAMVVSSLPRNIALILLQADLKIKKVFYVDAVHFLGAPVVILAWSILSKFDSALDLLLVTICSQAGSSLLGLVLVRRDLRFSSAVTRGDLHKLWNYGKYTLGAAIGSFTGSRADTFILSASAGLDQLALYNSAKIFLRAYDMVAQVIQMLIVPAASKISSRGDKRSLVALVEKAIFFSSVAMVPLFLAYMVFPESVIRILYKGKYLDAIPLLRIFALPALVVPAMSVAGTALLGLGRARASFWIGTLTAITTLGLYMLLIPWLGAQGAAWAVVVSSFAIAVIALRTLEKDIPFTLEGILNRYSDISIFIKQSVFHRSE